jgi:hypothetical protein
MEVGLRIARAMSGTLVPIIILYIGDFDPSGLDIERAAMRGETNDEWKARRIREGRTGNQSQERKDGLKEHLEKHYGWEPGRFESQVTWTRVGITEDDLRNIPERARVSVKAGTRDIDGKIIKKGDSRTTAFAARYGDYGAEAEALDIWERGLLARRLRHAIHKHIDPVAWKASKMQERAER